MSEIRPGLPAFTPAPTPVRDDAARQAQAAFFRAALGTADAPPATTLPRSPLSTLLAASATPVTAPPLPSAVPPRAMAAGDPERPIRPGSLLDIRI